MYITRILSIVLILFTFLVSCDTADIAKRSAVSEMTLTDGSVTFLISTKNLLSGNYSFESLEIKIMRDGGQIAGNVVTDVSSLINEEGNIKINIGNIPLSSSPAEVEVTLSGKKDGEQKTWYGKEYSVIINSSETLSLTVYIYDTSTIESGILDLTISINSKPFIERIEMSDSTPIIDETITFTGIVSDDDPLLYYWVFDGFYKDESTEPSTDFIFKTSGTHTVTLKVYDLYNNLKKDEEYSFDELSIEFLVNVTEEE